MIGPGSIARRAVRAAIRRGLRIPRLRAVVQAELAADRRVARRPDADSTASPTPEPFVDDRGVAHPLDPTLRDRLKPSWRTMCDAVAVSAPPTDETLAGRARKATQAVAEMTRVLELVGGAAPAGRILEVGCYDGAVAFAVARTDGVSAIGSDLARYYVVQRPGEPHDADLAAETGRLAVLRERARVVAGTPPGRVGFVEDDITATRLEAGSFDLVMSFEVLEHVRDPTEALRSIARLLRPGGLTYHDYNPFFSVNGGHSLVTLDFAWGHARLTAAELERYLRTVRPSEADQALRFYRESLNRMTLADLDAAVTAAGLEPLAVIPWVDRSLVERADERVLQEVRRSYPAATVNDLVATFVTVVARRHR